MSLCTGVPGCDKWYKTMISHNDNAVIAQDTLKFETKCTFRTKFEGLRSLHIFIRISRLLINMNAVITSKICDK
jgi:hypothetical protein